MHLYQVLPLSLSLWVSSAVAQTVISMSVSGQPSSLPSSNGGAQAAAPSATMAAAPSVGPPFTNNSSPSTAQSGTQQLWAVKVGSPDGKFVFSPNVINGQPGDLIQFQFYARNHSVVSGNFNTPCAPNNVQQGSQKAATNAFFSGFMPTSAEGSLVYTIAITDTQPMWFYCSQAQHCQEGMVGVINPPKTGNDTIANYAALAAKATENVTPSAASNGGNSNLGPGSPVAGSNSSLTQTGALAQSTRSAGSVVKIASWELVGAAMLAWFIL